MIGNEESLDSYELHICVRDYCFARDDRLVGVAVIQLRDIVDQVSRSMPVSACFAQSLTISTAILFANVFLYCMKE